MANPGQKAKPKRQAHPISADHGPVDIWIVDDHPIVRQGLTQLVQQDPDLTVGRDLGSAKETLGALREALPDLLVIDLSLQDVNGLELMKQIKAQWPTLPMLALSMHDETLYAERALRAGALGYIMKQEGTEKLVTAIRTVLRGELYVSEAMARRMLGRVVSGRPDTRGSPLDALSDRELEIFELVGRGLSTRAIAERLHVSVKTVESHRDHIKAKLQLNNAIELVQHATQWALDEPQS